MVYIACILHSAILQCVGTLFMHVTVDIYTILLQLLHPSQEGSRIISVHYAMAIRVMDCNGLRPMPEEGRGAINFVLKKRHLYYSHYYY